MNFQMDLTPNHHLVLNAAYLMLTHINPPTSPAHGTLLPVGALTWTRRHIAHRNAALYLAWGRRRPR